MKSDYDVNHHYRKSIAIYRLHGFGILGIVNLNNRTLYISTILLYFTTTFYIPLNKPKSE